MVPDEQAPLPVIFRAERSGQFKGEVTAVFPTLPGTNEHDFTTYAHVGQHDTGTMAWYNTTRPARADEYANLLRELQRIYGSEPNPTTLKVVKRITRKHSQLRRSSLGGGK